MVKKVVILIAALAMPILVYFFLKAFGKNEFEVAPFYQEGSLPVTSACLKAYTVPYTVAEAALEGLNWSSTDSLSLVVFPTANFDDAEARQRLSEAYRSSELKYSTFASEGELQQDSTDMLRQCVLFIPPNMNSVLIDNKKRIRGYYDLNERKEVDRLVVEVRIILKKY